MDKIQFPEWAYLKYQGWRRPWFHTMFSRERKKKKQQQQQQQKGAKTLMCWPLPTPIQTSYLRIYYIPFD